MKDQEFIVQKIRTQYTEKQHSELDALKALDAKVKKPANVFAYTYGAIGTIVLGAGMSMILVFEGLLLPGILVGAAGLLMLLCLIPVCFGLK